MAEIIKYKHLHAWDTMQGSYDHWKEKKQEDAKRTNAPIDAIFQSMDGTWEIAGSIPHYHQFWQVYKTLFGK
jgi:hypothetical protein